MDGELSICLACSESHSTSLVDTVPIAALSDFILYIQQYIWHNNIVVRITTSLASYFFDVE